MGDTRERNVWIAGGTLTWYAICGSRDFVSKNFINMRYIDLYDSFVQGLHLSNIAQMDCKGPFSWAPVIWGGCESPPLATRTSTHPAEDDRSTQHAVATSRSSL